jgi:hypothetical protein
MNKPDELDKLWKTQPVDPLSKEEMQNHRKKDGAFDSAIRLRNRVESRRGGSGSILRNCRAEHNAIENWAA